MMKAERPGFLSAILASTCGAVPLGLVFLGVGGLGVGSVIVAYHCYLTVGAVAALACAWGSFLHELRGVEAVASDAKYNRTGRPTLRATPLLLGIVLVASSPAKGEHPMKASTGKVTPRSVNTVEPLFTAVLQYRSDSPDSAVVPTEGHDGAFIGTGDGAATGERVRGAMSWSLWSGNCLYPLMRAGQEIPDGLHLCTINPVGFIVTHDGARIRFEGRGYGLRTPEKYHTSLTFVFGTEDARYAWLTHVLGVSEGEFDEKAGRATWNVYVPGGTH